MDGEASKPPALGQVASETRRERAGSPRRTRVYVEGCQGARNEVWRSKLTQCLVRSPARGHRMPPMSRLKAPLEQLCREADWARRIDRDAIRYPLRYPDPADREIVAL